MSDSPFTFSAAVAAHACRRRRSGKAAWCRNASSDQTARYGRTLEWLGIEGGCQASCVQVIVMLCNLGALTGANDTHPLLRSRRVCDTARTTSWTMTALRPPAHASQVPTAAHGLVTAAAQRLASWGIQP